MNAGTDETDRRLTTTVGLVVVLGSISVGWALWRTWSFDNFAHAPWLRIACLTGAATVENLVALQVRIKSSRQSVSMEEAILLFGLALLPGQWLVLSTTSA